MVVKTDSEWISLPEAARELGVTWATAWNALLRGRLDGQKRGRVWVVRCSSVERYRRLRSVSLDEPA
ncbi:MAG: helix-turn-helix domain-containing protein [Gemmatimonadales bacterium]|nr:helix-turn-helix domain-containing protein [Gemmatimonadales bacterium]